MDRRTFIGSALGVAIAAVWQTIYSAPPVRRNGVAGIYVKAGETENQFDYDMAFLDGQPLDGRTPGHDGKIRGLATEAHTGEGWVRCIVLDEKDPGVYPEMNQAIIPNDQGGFDPIFEVLRGRVQLREVSTRLLVS